MDAEGYQTRKAPPKYATRSSDTGADDTRSGNSAGDDGESDKSDNDADADTHGGFEDDVAMLRDYCLVAVNETGDEFEMHGLVQLSTRKWLEAAGRQDTLQRQYIQRMAAVFPTGHYENWPTCLRLFAHVQVALDYRPEGDGQDAWATLLYNGGWYALSQGRYNVAEQMADSARKAQKKRLGNGASGYACKYIASCRGD